MPAYDAELFDPPAPVAEVTLSNPDTPSTTAARMLLDTGADVTLISEALAGQVGVTNKRNEYYELMGFDGSATFYPAVQMDLVFQGRRFGGRFLLIAQAWGILGRDILNHLSLRLDGPQGVWEYDL